MLAIIIFACGQPAHGASFLSVAEMAPDGTPLLPSWLKSGMSENLYVGISVPSTDGKAAKESALTNAVAIYAMANGGTATYMGEKNTLFEDEDYKEMKTSLRGEYHQARFSVTVLQEYYNSEGEYFVLCKIVPDENSRNFFNLYWGYKNEWENGEYRGDVKAIARLALGDTKEVMQTFFQTTWDRMDVSIGCSVNEKNVFLTASNIFQDIKNDPNSNLIEFNTPAGLTQQRLLYGLPWWPASLDLKERNIYGRIGEKNGLIEENLNLRFSGVPRPRRLVTIVPDKSKVIFSLEDVFPAEYDEDSTERLCDLSANYMEDWTISDGSYVFECAKNEAFINALCCWFKKHLKEEYEPWRATISLKEVYEIYPLWYLDNEKRMLENTGCTTSRQRKNIEPSTMVSVIVK